MIHWLGFERRVAVRFLREGRMQSLLIIVGVAAGVAVVAYISALISGLQTNTLEKTLGAQAHVSISPLEDMVMTARETLPANTIVLEQTQARAQRPRSVPEWQSLLPQLQALPGVTAVSPMVAGAGLALAPPTRASDSCPAQRWHPRYHQHCLYAGRVWRPRYRPGVRGLSSPTGSLVGTL